MGEKISSICAKFASKWWEIWLQIVDDLVPIYYIKYPVGKTTNNVEISCPNDGIIRSHRGHTSHNWSNQDPTGRKQLKIASNYLQNQVLKITLPETIQRHNGTP